MLGKVIGTIVVTFFPMHDEMAEADSVADPIELHVHGLGASLLDRVVDNSLCACIIRLYGHSWLGMTHFVKGGA